jgi:hypothetical protein
MSGTYEKMLTFLRQTDLPAADQALGCALLIEQGGFVSDLASALISRGADEGVAYGIRAYHKLNPQLRQALADRCPGISGALRAVSRDKNTQYRENVVSLIGVGNHPKLAYILAYMLHDDVPAVRTKAAGAYKNMAMALLSRSQVQPKDAPGGSKSILEDLHQFFLTLDNALDTFPNHLRTEVVEAAMYFGPLLPENLWNKFIGDRSRVGRTAAEILQRDSNLNFAGFAFRALTCPDLGKNVIRIIASSCNCDFLRRWLSFNWYRFDLQVRKNLARINKEFRWLAGNLQPLLETPPEFQIKFIDVLMLTTIPASDKLELLGTLLVTRDPHVQEYVVSTLIRSDLPDTNKLLVRAVTMEQAIVFSARASRMANRHLMRVDPASRFSAATESLVAGKDLVPGIEQYFDQFWQAFDRLNLGTCRAALERLQRLDEHFSDHVRGKLCSADPTERCRAVALVRRGKLTQTFSEEIYHLCRDIDVTTRSAAVSTLVYLPGPLTEQKIIEALDDDDPRVQANAIDVLDALNPPDLPNILETKLSSPNNRIRANAIKAILRPQYSLALRALSAMLDHPDPTFRRSALWAVMKTTPLFLGAKVSKLAQNDPDPEVKTFARQAMESLVVCWRESQKNDDTAAKVGVN